MKKWLQEAKLFALECVDILVTEHGANRGGVDIEHFFHRHLGQTGIAMQIDTPQQMVEWSLANMHHKILGLEPASPDWQAKIAQHWKEFEDAK